MATVTETAPPPSDTTAGKETPQLTVLTRVASIPLISDSLSVINSTLAGNSYTKMPYSAAQAIGTTAYRVTEPIQIRLAPVIMYTDGLANKAVDVVESRYPYPFKAPTEEIYGTLKQHGEHAYGVANKTIDDRVRTPAFGLAQGIDQSFTPVVDRFEVVVNKFNGKTNESDRANTNGTVAEPSKDQFQYQRAYRLSMGLKDQIYVYTSDQAKQIQEHNKLVQRATATAQSVSAALSSSYGAASQRVQGLSDTMVAELQSLQKSAAQLPAHAQASLHGLSERVGTVVGEVREVLRSEAPIGEKLAKLRETVEHQVQPLLESATATVNGAMKAVRGKADEASAKQKSDSANGTGAVPNGTVVNGNGAAH